MGRRVRAWARRDLFVGTHEKYEGASGKPEAMLHQAPTSPRLLCWPGSFFVPISTDWWKQLQPKQPMEDLCTPHSLVPRTLTSVPHSTSSSSPFLSLPITSEFLHCIQFPPEKSSEIFSNERVNKGWKARRLTKQSFALKASWLQVIFYKRCLFGERYSLTSAVPNYICICEKAKVVLFEKTFKLNFRAGSLWFFHFFSPTAG